MHIEMAESVPLIPLTVDQQWAFRTILAKWNKGEGPNPWEVKHLWMGSVSKPEPVSSAVSNRRAYMRELMREKRARAKEASSE